MQTFNLTIQVKCASASEAAEVQDFLNALAKVNAAKGLLNLREKYREPLAKAFVNNILNAK